MSSSPLSNDESPPGRRSRRPWPVARSPEPASEASPPAVGGEWWIAKANAGCILQLRGVQNGRWTAIDEVGKTHQIGEKALHQRFRRYGTTPAEQRVILRSKLIAYRCAWKYARKEAERQEEEAVRLGRLESIIHEALSAALDEEVYDQVSEELTTEMTALFDHGPWLEIAENFDSGSGWFPVRR